MIPHLDATKLINIQFESCPAMKYFVCRSAIGSTVLIVIWFMSRCHGIQEQCRPEAKAAYLFVYTENGKQNCYYNTTNQTCSNKVKITKQSSLKSQQCSFEEHYKNKQHTFNLACSIAWLQPCKYYTTKPGRLDKHLISRSRLSKNILNDATVTFLIHSYLTHSNWVRSKAVLPSVGSRLAQV